VRLSLSMTSLLIVASLTFGCSASELPPAVSDGTVSNAFVSPGRRSGDSIFEINSGGVAGGLANSPSRAVDATVAHGNVGLGSGGETSHNGSDGGDSLTPTGSAATPVNHTANPGVGAISDLANSIMGPRRLRLMRKERDDLWASAQEFSHSQSLSADSKGLRHQAALRSDEEDDKFDDDMRKLLLVRKAPSSDPDGCCNKKGWTDSKGITCSDYAKDTFRCFANDNNAKDSCCICKMGMKQASGCM